MRLNKTIVVVLATVLVATGIVMCQVAPWFGALMLVIAAVVLIAILPWNRGQCSKEGDKMEGSMNYKIVEGKLALTVYLPDMMADYGLPRDMTSNVLIGVRDDGVDYYFIEGYELGEMDDFGNARYCIKRLVMVRTDVDSKMRGLNVLLNGVSYEAKLTNDDAPQRIMVWSDVGNDVSFRVSEANFIKLAEAFGEREKLDGWPLVENTLDLEDLTGNCD